MPAVLSSDWTGLSKYLLATIFPVKADGTRDVGPDVVAPPTDGTMEATANWQSPFEQSGPESRAPAIMAMLQTGVLPSYAQGLSKIQASNPIAKLILGALQGAAEAATDLSKAAQGRSGMTKLNSTQIFSGAPPLKLPMTLHFRALKDPVAEVRAPVDQLWQWFLAQELAPNGAIVSALTADSVKSALLPSVAPQMVGLRFGGFTLAPMVIESLSHPITVSRGIGGEALHMTVSIVLASLTALDQGDWRRAREGMPTRLFNNN